MRTVVYVDGFNLFHRLLEGRVNVKWLDLFSLARTCLRDENDVRMVRYFTARVTGTLADPDQPSRQDVYLRALSARGVKVHYDTFRQALRRISKHTPISFVPCGQFTCTGLNFRT